MLTKDTEKLGPSNTVHHLCFKLYYYPCLCQLYFQYSGGTWWCSG